MNSRVPPVLLTIIVENTNYAYVNSLNPQTIREELEKWIERGDFERIDMDLPIIRYRNLKPKSIQGKGEDNETFLIIKHPNESLQTIKIV
ncbi:hypothetical protein GO755_29565 [Spirosoma sp. HMF4905]|uniref:Uncharacterized protein n=1 Tax=Spirosoma arboris TaxID=2682092 RepID=A0A7K1SKV8_9BACT|nr:hypothetical protein [Spirosoma arboris]MVM34216.1 hypothetical protein [Spirosoma arboris]